MRTEISKLHNSLNATMIYVTHDQIEAMTMGTRIVVLKDGLIQQVADPMTLYDSPVNKFVAGFIGSPAMNFMEGRVVRNGGLHFDEGTFKAPIPPEYENTLAAFAGKPIVFGVRPESLSERSADPGTGAGAGFKATVEVVEPMGSETFVYVTTGKNPVVARLTTRREIKPSSTISLSIDMKRTHFFDPGDEKTLV
jgi:multiple sugar transport system ATP-binding protein